MNLNEFRAAQERAGKILGRAGVVLNCEEATHIEVADFGLDRLDQEGLELVTYVNTDRYCAKELVIFPGQTCPEHRHPPRAGVPGKQETFRCRWGELRLYVDGEPTPQIQATAPEAYYTVFHEIILRLGSSSQFPLIPCIGSKPDLKARSSPSSPAPATTNPTFLPIPIFSAKPGLTIWFPESAQRFGSGGKN